MGGFAFPSVSENVDRIQELAGIIKEKVSEYETIKNRCKDENRLPTPEETAQLKSLQKEIIEHQQASVLERDEAEMFEALNTSVRPPQRAVVDREDELMRKFPGLPKKEDRFEDFADFSRAAIQAEPRVGGPVDRRLVRAATGMGEATPADGGFMLQQDLASRIIEPLFDPERGDPILSRVTTTNLTAQGANGIAFNAIDETTRETSNWGGIKVYWMDEGTEKTASQAKLRRVELKLKKAAGLCYLTDELMEDVPALSTRLERGFRIALRSALHRAIIRGTGAGQPLGVLNSSAKISVSAEAGQAAATIVPENVVNMYASLEPDAINPVWLYNPTAVKQIYLMQVALGAAGALVNMPGNNMSRAPFSELLGLPLIKAPWCSVLGTEGDLILVDLANYEFIQKGGPKVNYSIHVRFIYDETAMRIVFRCDGRPSAISSTTLEDGTNTVSPIVTLETRS